MIKALNGSLVTTTAVDQDVIPYEPDGNGNLRPAGRNTFCLSWVSGTVKTVVGVSSTNPPSGYTVLSQTGAANWVLTASPQEGDNQPENIHASGGGTFNITW